MRIAYVADNWLGMPGNGIVSQAETWMSLLGRKGIEVILVSPWDKVDWNNIDIVHFFGSSGVWFYNAAQMLKRKGVKVVWSPICDNIDSPKLQRLKAYVGCSHIGMFSLPYMRKKTYGVVDAVFVRSDYEREYILRSYGIDAGKFILVPLAMSYDGECDVDYSHKESFCFHLSSISQPRKNVVRLIQAARKYGFRLILAGNKGNDSDYAVIEHVIRGAENIDVLGFITEEEKVDLYRRAKVFALPSINEGVGIVALDAAHFGCEVVVTSIGGPKEYYDDKAFVVNPYNVDDIGGAVTAALNGKYQPMLKEHVDRLYSLQNIAKNLVDAYTVLIDK